MSDHGHFSSYEGNKERQTGKIRGAFSRMHRALDGWILARAPASSAQGLHHDGPRYFNFSYFCTTCGLRVVLNMIVLSLFVTQYVSQIETRLRTILIIKRVRVIFSHTDDLFYGKNTFCLF